MAGAPTGNNNATKSKPWSKALNKVLENYNAGSESKVEKYHALIKMGEKLVDMALDGDLQAIREIGDRIDGKAVQAIAGTIEHDHTHSHTHEPVSESNQWLAGMLGNGKTEPTEKPDTH